MATKLLTPEEIAELTPDELATYNAGIEADKKQPDDEKDKDMIAKLVQERVEAELKELKSKLDGAYGSRDDALKKVAEFEQKEKELNLKRLQDEGKHKEAYELQLAEEKAKREALEKRNTELTRDVTVRDVLKGYAFRNENAADMAYREIVNQLMQNDKGEWIHRSGISIKDFVLTFSTSDDNSFLFKSKTNSGSGNTDSNKSGNPSGEQKTSVFKMTQEEVLKLASEGKLPNQK